MNNIITGRKMKQFDSYTSSQKGMLSLVLMERAALSVVEEVEKREHTRNPILIVCGVGNNGGDGIAIGRILHLRGKQVQIVLIGDEGKASKETSIQLEIAKNYGIRIYHEIPINSYSIILDAIFGIGLIRNIEGAFYQAIDTMNQLSGFKIAVDIPSGVDGDDGNVKGIAFYADLSVTFAYNKIGMVLYPGAQYAGTIIVKDIGIYGEDFDHSVFSLERDDLQLIPKRATYANKGTFGKVFVVGGTLHMAGAPLLTAKAAYRTGCGLVKVFTREENRIILQTGLPEAILSTYSQDVFDLDELRSSLKWCDVVVIGPGLGMDNISQQLLKLILKEAVVPVIIDADAINLIAQDDLLKKLVKQQGQCNHAYIFTPHLSEMSRLIKKPLEHIKSDLIETASTFAIEMGHTCILKDTRTVIATSKGHVFLNQSGNNGMSTGGSGDVLSGILGGLIAQKTPWEYVGALGVYLHGLSGDAAAKKRGKHSMLAGDIVDGIATVLFEENEYV